MITVPLDPQEREALRAMAETDCRHPREELRFLLREAARRRGLLPPETEPASAGGDDAVVERSGEDG